MGQEGRRGPGMGRKGGGHGQEGRKVGRARAALNGPTGRAARTGGQARHCRQGGPTASSCSRSPAVRWGAAAPDAGFELLAVRTACVPDLRAQSAE